jgi:hypothetical protein
MEKRIINFQILQDGLNECLTPYITEDASEFPYSIKKINLIADDTGIETSRLLRFCGIAVCGKTLKKEYSEKEKQQEVTSADYPTLKETLAIKLYNGVDGKAVDRLIRHLRYEEEFFVLAGRENNNID